MVQSISAMELALGYSFIDADRLNTPSPGNGKRTSSYRVRLAVALVLLAVVWQIVRLLVVR
jgi:hypothetical protein